ncbi:MAG TPA: hypothetical protein VGX50_16260 [Longimicrobium sp.]|nr:hypothetical protein [Longimicrobium sp.]
MGAGALASHPERPDLAERVRHSAELSLPDALFGQFQLPPGLLQPERLLFELLSAESEREPVWLIPGTDPLCAWVVHDFLDQSLAVYSAAGEALGAFSLGRRRVSAALLDPEPGAPPVGNRHLAGFMDGVGALDAGTFAALLEAIDTSRFPSRPLIASPLEDWSPADLGALHHQQQRQHLHLGTQRDPGLGADRCERRCAERGMDDGGGCAGREPESPQCPRFTVLTPDAPASGESGDAV